MAKHFVRYLLFAIGLIVVVCSCNKQQKAISQGQARGIYYWKTSFRLSPCEKDFLKNHMIDRLYIRLFDVAYETDYDGQRKSIPIATINFIDSLPKNIEIIPVIYITQDAIEYDPDFQELLYKRVKAMANKHQFANFKEMQLDCDWSNKTRDHYFGLCDKLRKLLKKDDRILSSTIRLHQLQQTPPPVDCGVLMIYNTGSIYDPASNNSILDYEDAKPYLTKNIHYSLPLSLAYPTYSWSIALDNNKFQYILHQTEFSNMLLYDYETKNIIKVKEGHEIEGKYVSAGTMIRREIPTIEDIIKVKGLVTSRICSPIANNIIYHLDEKELSKYSDDEIEQILK